MRRDLFVAILCVMMHTAVGAQERTIESYLSRAKSLYDAGLAKEAQGELHRALSDAATMRRVSPAVSGEVAFLNAKCEALLGDGAAALGAYLIAHPDSPYKAESLYLLGKEHYEAGRFMEALEAWQKVEMRELNDKMMEELCFGTGHANYQIGDVGAAREWLERIAREDAHYFHSQYLLGIIAYVDGDYIAAREHFRNVAMNEDYEPIIPYYLINVEHRLGNNLYVARNADSVLDGIEGSRRAEIRRIAAQATFLMEEWSEAERHIAALRDQEQEALSREENYIAGYALYRLGEWERAAGYLRGACAGEDTLTRNAAYHLADCLLRKGDKRGAMQCFSMAYAGEDSNPISEDAHYNYCKLQVELGGSNFNEEIRTLQSYLHRYPRSAHRKEMEGYLISACYAANDLRGAYAILEEYVGSGARIKEAMQSVAYYYAAECYARGDYKESEEYLNKALDYKEYDENIAARTLYLLGEVDYQQGRYREAASMFDQYIALEKTHQREYPLAFYNMGYANFNTSRFAAAYHDFRDFVEVSTGGENDLTADAWNRMGDAKAALKEYKSAAEHYRKSAAMESNERYYGAYRVALMEGMAGNTIARIEALEDILARGKGNYVTRAHYELGNTLLSSGNYKRAVEVLADYVKLYPSSRDYTAALADLGLAYRNTGNNDAALGAYKQIVSSTRGSLAAHNALAEIRNIYIERNDVDGFFEYADGVGVSGDMGSVQRDSLSFVAAQRLYISGDKSAASAAFDKYITENPEGVYSPAALYYAADCRATLGDSLGARESLKKLTSLYYNAYTQRGYERLAQLAAAGADWKAAASAWREVAELATTSSAKREALEKYLATTVEAAENPAIIQVADYIIAHPECSEELNRKARFEKAKALEANGKRNPAVAIFSALSADVTTPEGAESAYRIIETAFRFGSFEKAESLVYEFADKNTPHAYWLAKSFLLLGDVYLSRGDLFQARATYQSVVDGYSNKEDGIVETAMARIESLGGVEN